MPERQSIRNEGRDAEASFLRLVSGSRASDHARLGDVIVRLDGADHYVEVKQCQSRGGTINQVRAIKFTTCVILAPERGGWYVLAPDQLVLLAATKDRGQHTEIPFECMNFSLDSLPSNYHAKVAGDGLAAAVYAAIRRGVAAAGMRELMRELLEDIQEIRTKYADAVRQANE